MNLGGTAGTVAEIVKTCANIQLQIATSEKLIKELKDEFSAIRLEHVKMEGRISKLEENRDTLKEQLGRIADKAVSDVLIMKASIEADLKVQAANLLNDTKIRLMQIENERAKSVLTSKKED